MKNKNFWRQTRLVSRVGQRGLEVLAGLLLGLGWMSGRAQTTVTFTNSGSWTCPVGVTTVQVECWGGGGAGGSATGTAGTGNGATGGGGAGGAYAKLTEFSVNPTMAYAVTVGAGGVSSMTDGAAVAGGDSWFNSSATIRAQGGAGGQSVSGAKKLGMGGTGSAAASLGTITLKGGSGYTSTDQTAGPSSGGGGSAGSMSEGTSAISNLGGAGGVTGGGAGGNGPTSNGKDGSAGTAPGGGGGGAWAAASTTQRMGGNGAAGKVLITYTPVTAPALTTQAASNLAATGVMLNGTVHANGGASLNDRGFYWSAAPGVNVSGNQISEGGTTIGTFSKALTGLGPNTIYYYRAYAANPMGIGIGGSDVSFYTLANTPSAPTVSNPTPNSLNISITPGDGNPATTLYAVKETISGNYVQAGGAGGGGLGTAAVYLTAANWSATLLTNLNASTTYTFAAVATNGAGTPTGFSVPTSGTTLATPLAAWDFTGPGSITSQTAAPSDPNLASVPNLTRGPGAAASPGANSFRTTGFQNDGISTTNSDYFQVALAAAPGKHLSLSTIDARFAGTASFAASPGVAMQFAYSLNGTAFTLIGSSFAQIGSGSMAQIDVTGIGALQNIPSGTTVTIRLYASGQTTSGGWGFNSPLGGTYGLSIGGAVTTPTITAAATAATFTMTYGTASLAQTFSVSGAYLATNIIASAPAGFEVASDGLNYGSSATFAPSDGSVGGTLSVRLKATAAVAGTYDSQNIALTSPGATTVNITTTSSGNLVRPATLTYVANASSMTYGGTVPSVSGRVAGFVNGENQASATTGTLSFSAAATASSAGGVYPITGGGLSAANYTLVQAAGNSTAFRVNPAPGTFAIKTTKNNPATFATSKIIHFANDGGTAMYVSAVASPSAQGGRVVLDENTMMITYTPATDATAADNFTYTLSDTAGGSSVGIVNVTINEKNVTGSLKVMVTNGSAKVIASGIPGQLYDLETRTDGEEWTYYDQVTAGANGLVSYTDPEPVAQHGSRLYRLKQH